MDKFIEIFVCVPVNVTLLIATFAFSIFFWGVVAYGIVFLVVKTLQVMGVL